jgi:hypothetical protein
MKKIVKHEVRGERPIHDLVNTEIYRHFRPQEIIILLLSLSLLFYFSPEIIDERTMGLRA